MWGGVLIGLSSASLLLCFGRIAGCSGIYAEVVKPRGGGAAWRMLFMIGLALGGAVAAVGDPRFPSPIPLSPVAYAVAGLCVGAGTRIGDGCTSGHGICGLARFSTRSLMAVCTFMASGALTAFCGQRAAGRRGGAPKFAPVRWPPRLGFPVAATVGCLAVLSLSVRLAMPSRTDGRLAAVYVSSGATFALGLSISGMLDQGKVLAFLDVFGEAWDPSLAFVMGGGLGVSLVAHRVARHREDAAVPPLLRSSFAYPVRGEFGDGPVAKLIFGNLLFGIGWGLGGICPGPAIAGLAHPFASPDFGSRFALFLLAMSAGIWAADAVLHRGEGLKLDDTPPKLAKTTSKTAPADSNSEEAKEAPAL